MEIKVVNLMKRAAPTTALLLSVDRIEMMLLTTGLELIRFAANTHFRGIVLSSADRLDHMLCVAKAAIVKDSMSLTSEFADIQRSVITVWNDEQEKKKDFLRSHMIHYGTTMCVGYGQNALQKRNWNGLNLEGIKLSEREIKRRLRVIIYNDDVETKFDEPVFNQEKGTYNLDNSMNDKIDDFCELSLDKPLLPACKEGMKRIIIR